MNDRHIDRMACALATNASRRKAALGALAIGATALVGARRSEAQAPAPGVSTICAGDGQPCVMLTGCCSGFTCVTNAINPNQGFCQSGGSGGVQIAPPMVAANATGSTTQAAPTKTPRTHKTHTPGSNHTNTNTNTRPAFDLRITLQCYGAPETLTVRNIGTLPVTLSKFETTGPSSLYNGKNPWTPNLASSLRPGKTAKFYADTQDAPAGTTFEGTKWSDQPVFLQDGTDGLRVYIDETTQTFTKSCGQNPSGTATAKSRSKHKQKRHR